MSSVLSEVLAFKRQRDAEARADIDAIPQAIATFITAKQQAQKSMLDKMTLDLTAASKGLRIGADGSITRDISANPLEEMTLKLNAAKAGFNIDPKTGTLTQNPEYLQNAGGNVLLVGNDGQVEVAGSYGKRDKVFKKSLTPEEMGDRAAAVGSEQQKFFKEAEITDLKDISDTRDTLSEVRSGLEALGVKDPSQYGSIETETIDSNFGPISIPARFNLVGQYAKDPKYTAVKQKLERAFNKYRKIITGAQASEGELRILRDSFASFTNRPGVFFENLSTLENETNRMIDSRLKLYEAIGRDVSNVRDLYSKGVSTANAEKSKPSGSKYKIVEVRNG